VLTPLNFIIKKTEITIPEFEGSIQPVSYKFTDKIVKFLYGETSSCFPEGIVQMAHSLEIFGI
jgi:hypothetical protein